MDAASPQLTLVSASILFGLIQAVVLLVFFMTRSPRNARFLTIALIAIFVLEAEAFLKETGYLSSVIHLMNVASPFVLLIGPCLYLYAQEQLGRRLTARRICLHLSPFLFYALYSTFFFVQSASFKHQALAGITPVPGSGPVPTDPLDIQGVFVVEGFVVHLIVYGLAGLIMILKAKKLISTDERRAWLLHMQSIVILSAIVLFLAEGGVINGWRFFENPIPDATTNLFSVAVIYLFTLLLINQSQLLRSPRKYAKSALPDPLKARARERILHLLKNDQPYLRQSFSLRELAEATGLRTHHLSQVLNDELDLSFSELTHRYRIAEARQRLLDEYPIKMESLAHELGYGSKSTFFAAFKKATGMTPGQYRTLHRESDPTGPDKK